MPRACIDCGTKITKGAIRCRSCATRLRWQQGSLKPRKKKRVKRICGYCGKEFLVSPAYLRANPARFCSRACASKSCRNQIRRICGICGQEFFVVPSRIKYGFGKYCSQGCMGRAYSKEVDRICEFCNKEFRVNLTQAAGRFCSYECMGKAKRNRIKKTCGHCDKIFETIPSRCKDGEGRFCSPRCWYKYSTGENNPGWKDRTEIACKECRTKFKVRPSLAWRRFCSRGCSDKWLAEHPKTGKEHSQWKGGISFEPYGIEFNDDLKQYIRGRDGYRCAVCGGSGRCVHHIDYDKKNNDPANLITLDKSCHTKTNYNRKFWQIVLTPIAIRRENVSKAC